MQSAQIFLPMMVVLAIPVFVLLLNGKRKSVDRKNGTARAEAAIDNTAWSAPVILTSNSLANQFQLPVVFYVLGFILFNINAVSTLVLALCWIFALSRWGHAIVHVTTNKIPHRMALFAVSTLALFILFGITAVRVVNFG